jgi:hypothetical protein
VLWQYTLGNTSRSVLAAGLLVGGQLYGYSIRMALASSSQLPCRSEPVSMLVLPSGVRVTYLPQIVCIFRRENDSIGTQLTVQMNFKESADCETRIVVA